MFTSIQSFILEPGFCDSGRLGEYAFSAKERWAEDMRGGSVPGRPHRVLCVCVCVCLCARTHAQSCPTLCDPMDCSLPGSFVQGIFQVRIPEGVAISCSRGSSKPRDRTQVSCVSCFGKWILYHCATIGFCSVTIIHACLRKYYEL